MALHHATLKAAVSKYLPLKEEGKSQGDIVAAIKADEKGFDEEAVTEIYDAIIGLDETKSKESNNQQTTEKKKKQYVVAKPFRDINNFNVEHHEGKDVSHFDQERLDKLVANGHVKIDD